MFWSSLVLRLFILYIIRIFRNVRASRQQEEESEYNQFISGGDSDYIIGEDGEVYEMEGSSNWDTPIPTFQSMLPINVFVQKMNVSY